MLQNWNKLCPKLWYVLDHNWISIQLTSRVPRPARPAVPSHPKWKYRQGDPRSPLPLPTKVAAARDLGPNIPFYSFGNKCLPFPSPHAHVMHKADKGCSLQWTRLNILFKWISNTIQFRILEMRDDSLFSCDVKQSKMFETFQMGVVPGCAKDSNILHQNAPWWKKGKTGSWFWASLHFSWGYAFNEAHVNARILFSFLLIFF
jgi:hypothetical protein